MNIPDSIKPLTIIIPAFNEAATIGNVIEQTRQKCGDFVHEIIVIDDGSTDQTGALAHSKGARVIQHPCNMGYGAALKHGIRQATTQYIITMDADGQHRIEDVIKLWGSIGKYEMVVGQRTHLLHSPLWRMPGKWLLWALANYLSRQPIPDLNSGLRIIRRDVALKYLHLCPAGFSFSTTITMALLNRGYSVTYIPIEIAKRVGQSTVTLSTGLDTIILILRIATLFDPLRVFIPLSLIIVILGVVWGIPYAIAGRGVSVASMLAIVTAILLFGLGLLCDQISQMRLERFE
ncbi:MAG: glycosyltransferase family 2 protein [Chloroflexi bacterium]|nr:glycosyltransferase family 2 protein [Chloroflexota bacterium]